MLKNISNLGTVLNKSDQQSIKGGWVPGDKASPLDEQFCQIPENYYYCSNGTGGGTGGGSGDDPK